MNQPAESFAARFWGVRGSIAVPGERTVRYGGNTPCVEVRCGERLILLDGGTGLHAFGETAAAEKAVDADILLSHCHLDHIEGLPFFLSRLAGRDRVRIWAGNLLPNSTLAGMLGMIMSSPLFPIGLEQVKANIECRDFRAGEPIRIDEEILVRTAPLNHPGGASGYRIEFKGRSLAYVSDYEFGSNAFDPAVLALARAADLLIADSTYTEQEIDSRRGWGHSTWQDSVRLAEQAGARALCLFHHDPSHDDEFMDGLAAAAKAVSSAAFVAREGLVVRL